MARTQARVDIRILPVAALTAKEWDGIWELTQIYVETTRAFYEAKLRAFPEVALFRNRSGVLVGIVALDVYRADFRSETSTVLFTSSVVIDEPYRRHNLIQRTGFGSSSERGFATRSGRSTGSSTPSATRVMGSCLGISSSTGRDTIGRRRSAKLH
jgi:hypothetical protein